MPDLIAYLQSYWGSFLELSPIGKAQVLGPIVAGVLSLAFWPVCHLGAATLKAVLARPIVCRFPWGIARSAIALGIALTAASFLFSEQNLDANRELCLFGCKAPTAIVSRVQDYSNSYCDKTGRVYWNEIYDTYEFSEPVSIYRARWSGPPTHTPPTLLNVTNGEPVAPVAIPCPDESGGCIAREFRVPVIGRSVQLRWRYRENVGSTNEEDAPGGFSYQGRYPVTRLTVRALFPEGVAYSTSNTHEIGGVSSADLCERLPLGYTCNFASLPQHAWEADRRFRLPFGVAGWTQCPGRPQSAD